MNCIADDLLHTMNKTLKTITITVAVTLILACIAVLLASYAGYNFVIVYSDKEIGIKSYDGYYRLVRTADLSGRYLLFSVIQMPNDNSDIPWAHTVFVADDYQYFTRYISDYRWVDGSYDFIIYSTDSGPHYYKYKNGTWIAQ